MANRSRSAATKVRIKGTRLYVGGNVRESAFDGQSSGRRVRNWMPGSDGINSLLLGVQNERNRARDLARKTPWISAGIEALVANIIGEGIRPLPMGGTENYRSGLSELWREWCDDADASGCLDFYGLQSLAVRTMVESGECFIRKRPRQSSDGLAVPIQLQLLEPEHVPVEKNEILPNGHRIICGIEVDLLGRRVAYHMYRSHPGEGMLTGDNIVTFRIPASEVIHLYDLRRPGQMRGLPWLSPAIMRTRDTLEYDDAELVRKKTAAMFTGFVTRPDPEDDVINESDEDVDAVDEGVAITSLEPGTMQLLEPGEDVTFSSPADSGNNYAPFMKMNLHAIAAGLGTTYEQMTGDLEGVNFSSIRAGLLEFQRRAKRWQRLVIFQFCRAVWRPWIDTAVMSGALSAPGYMAPGSDLAKVKWVAPGWQYVNPSQEAAAAKMMMRAGVKPRSEVIAERGGDVVEVDAQFAADQNRADELGLVFDSDARQTTGSGGVADRDETSGGNADGNE